MFKLVVMLIQLLSLLTHIIVTNKVNLVIIHRLIQLLVVNLDQLKLTMILYQIIVYGYSGDIIMKVTNLKYVIGLLILVILLVQ